MKEPVKVALVLFFVCIFLVMFAFIVGFVTSLDFLYVLRIVFGAFYVLFLPGFFFSYLFFPKTRDFESKEEVSGSLDWIERIALSFALSIAVIPLVIFYLNLFGLKINTLNSFLTIFGIILVSLFGIYLRFIYERKSFAKKLGLIRKVN